MHEEEGDGVGVRGAMVHEMEGDGVGVVGGGEGDGGGEMVVSRV